MRPREWLCMKWTNSSVKYLSLCKGESKSKLPHTIDFKSRETTESQAPMLDALVLNTSQAYRE